MVSLRIKKNKRLASLLLDWFAANARDLPWRRTRDPYAIWVSEIMLQQTQVKTVIPYWERWMRELPTIQAVARASPAKLHKLWEGLGYYTRVRNLQKAARQIIAAHGGQFPQTFEAVLALPGIGRYTAGAICSIAFNQPTPILDGNVIRVLTRIHGLKADPREKRTNAQLWQLAQELVTHASRVTHHAPRKDARTRTKAKEEDDQNCSFLNQSLMELGALICVPRSPNCTVCPARTLCRAHQENLQDQLPNLGQRAATTERRFVAYILERDGKLLVHQRPAGVVNAHLWEFPNVEVGADTGRARHSVRAAAPQSTNGAQRTDAPYRQSDFRLTATRSLCTIKHSITRYRITLEAWRARFQGPHPTRPKPGGRWLTPKQLHRLALTGAHKKILAALEESSRIPRIRTGPESRLSYTS